MASIGCTECGLEIPTEASLCPNCGRATETQQRRTGRTSRGATALVLWVVLTGAFLGLFHLLGPQ